MTCIADAMCDIPEVTGDTHAASITRRAVDLPYEASSIMGIADPMPDSPDMAGDTHAAPLKRRNVDCLLWQMT